MAPRTSLNSPSPIDLGSAIDAPPVEFAVDYGKSVMHGHDARTTIEFSIAGGSSITYDGRRYELKGFHLHTPSEHAIDGEFFAVEIHFVNEDAEGNQAVLAVFAEESELARGPRRLEQAMPLVILLPESTTHYAYDGSLTTPPYSEGVQWIVLTDRVNLHPDWVEAFRDRYGANSRRLHPVGDRTITLRSGH
jgi:carbonic anhydrase